MAYVYRHIRLDTNHVFYVGIGNKPNYARALNKSDRNPIWKAVVAKTPYDVEILFDDLTWEQACEKEKEFIALYGRINLSTGTLANLTDGGDSKIGYIHKEETRKMMSEKMKGNLNGLGHKKNPDECRRISERVKANPMKPESIRKMAETKRGKKASNETKEKMKESQRLRRLVEPKTTRTIESIERMKSARKNRGPISEETRMKLKARRASAETKLKMSISQKRRFSHE